MLVSDGESAVVLWVDGGTYTYQTHPSQSLVQRMVGIQQCCLDASGHGPDGNEFRHVLAPYCHRRPRQEWSGKSKCQG